MTITKSEIKKRAGLFIFGIGTFYVALDLRDIISSNIDFPGWAVGLIIMIIALWFFELG